MCGKMEIVGTRRALNTLVSREREREREREGTLPEKLTFWQQKYLTSMVRVELI